MKPSVWEGVRGETWRGMEGGDMGNAVGGKQGTKWTYFNLIF